MTVTKRTTEAEPFLQQLTWELEPAEQYLKSFHWNKVKYRADKPLGEIIVTLQKVRGITKMKKWALADSLRVLNLCIGDLQYRQ